ncbi:hypothetical protein [Ferrovibrio sp.]|uniref:hypothetical protein n=1 Tax=Ferrovibrio sp. TaxID=1917215 RepID=UPI002633353D|nr:hypothetical protein [Ferrovibrio sp.]
MMDRLESMRDSMDVSDMSSPGLPDSAVLPWQVDGQGHAAAAAAAAVPLQDAEACRAARAQLTSAIAQGEAALSALEDITRMIGKIRTQIAVLGERDLAAVQQDIVRNNIALLAGRIGACVERAGRDGRNLLRGDGYDAALPAVVDAGVANGGGADGSGDDAGPAGRRNLGDAIASLLTEQGGMTNWLSMVPPNIFVAGYLLDGFAHQVDALLMDLSVQKQALEDHAGFIDAMLEAQQAAPARVTIAAAAIARAAACLS